MEIENDLAVTYLATGNVARARELAADARREFEEAGDDRNLCAVLDTEAKIALAADDLDGALALARRSLALARETGNQHVEMAARVRAREACSILRS